MIELSSEQLLQIVLAVSAAAMAALAAVFLAVVQSTRLIRGRGWFWGFAFFALALALDAFAQHDPKLETWLTYAATASAAAASAFTCVATFGLTGRRVPGWAFAVLGICDAAGFAIAARSDLTADLLAPECALLGAMVILAGALCPVARDARRLGVRTVCIVSVLLTLFMARTLVFSAVLASSGQVLNSFYWTWEVISGTLFAFVLAIGELVALLDEIRLEISENNVALSKALEGLEIAAKIDPLTGLHNRYAFYTLAGDFRQRGRLGGSIVILDLNDLKKINDTFGHHAGDRALLSVAQRIKGMASARDFVFRWGGDEFVLLLFGVDAAEADNRMKAMPPPDALQLHDGVIVPLGLSWGVSPLREDVEAALRDADAQLYAQKRSGNQTGKAAQA